FTSPQAAAKIVRNRDVFVKDPRTEVTDVMIARPVAGDWTLRALKGSTVRSIEQASIDPMPEISAGVGGKGEHRILGYAYEPQPLHATRFVEARPTYEQERGAAAAKPCKGVKPAQPSAPHCTEMHFTPAPAPAGARHIYAITT